MMMMMMMMMVGRKNRGRGLYHKTSVHHKDCDDQKDIPFFLATQGIFYILYIRHHFLAEVLK
jgi:hypothetical protein